MAESDGSLKIQVALDNKGFQAGAKELEAAARKTAASISGIGNQAKASMQKQINAFRELNQRYERQQQKVDQLKKKLEELSHTQVETKGYQDLTKEINQIEAALDRAIERQVRFTETGGNIKSRSFQQMEWDIEQLNEKLSEAKNRRDKLEASGGRYQSIDTSSVKTSLASEQEKLGQMQNRVSASYDTLNAKLERYQQKAANAAKRGEVFRKVSERLNGTLKKLTGRLKEGIGSLLKFGAGARQSGNGFLSSLKAIIRYSIGLQTLFSAVRLAHRAITDGIRNLVQVSSPANAAVSSLMTSLMYLKNALASAFSPILTVAAPLLTGFINMLARAVTYVGMFFAALTGAKSFKKAIPAQEDFAAGLQDTASNAENAAEGLEDAEKAANGYLSPLDEIDRYDEGKDSGGGGGEIPGYQPPSAEDMFEDVPIESAISDFVEKIKALIAAQDWEGLGKLLADKINSVVGKINDAISWDKVGPKITYFVNAFTQTLNSLVRNIDWELMGETIGNGINTVVNTLLLFITGIDWVLIGSSFARGMNSLVDTVDWWNLGNLLGQKFMIAWNLLYGFVTTLDWVQVGLALANGINGAIAAIDGTTIGTSIYTFVSGLLAMITTAAQTTDWQAVGQTVADMLNAIDWVDLAAQLYEAGKALISGLLTAFGELPTPVIVATSLILAFWAAIKMGKTISTAVTAIKGVVEAITGAGGLISALKAGIAMIGGPTTLAIIAIVAVVAGAVALIITHWDEVKAFMAGLLEWLQSLFLTDWTTVFGDAGLIINDFFSGISTFIGGVKDVFQGLITFLTGIFTGDWGNAWGGIVTLFGGVFDMIVGLAKTPINAVIDLINGMISAVESGLNWVISGVNKIGFTVPDWVPGIGGNSFGINIPPVSWGRIPRLATGAVIPPGSEFLAVLGDQKRGTNIETPESLLRQIMREELGGRDNSGNRTYRFTAQINRRVLFDEMMEEARARQDQSGENPFELA